MANGQTMYKNRTQTHALQQPAQESNLLIYNNQRREPAWWESHLQEVRWLCLITIQKVNNYFWTNRSQTSRTWLITDSSPNFCPGSQCRTKYRKPKGHPNQSHRMSCLQLLHPDCSNQPDLKPSFLTEKLSQFPACLWVSTQTQDRGWLRCNNTSEEIGFALLLWLAFISFGMSTVCLAFWGTAKLPSAQSPLQPTCCGRAKVPGMAPLSHSPSPLAVSFDQTRFLPVCCFFFFSL